MSAFIKKSLNTNLKKVQQQLQNLILYHSQLFKRGGLYVGSFFSWHDVEKEVEISFPGLTSFLPFASRQQDIPNRFL